MRMGMAQSAWMSSCVGGRCVRRPCAFLPPPSPPCILYPPSKLLSLVINVRCVCAQDNGGKAALKSETPAGVIHVASASSIWNEGGLIKIQAPNPKDPTGPERV
eukprot:COSAG01_NODE_990_length_12289_cov_22.606545_5_plen_104_part_00